MKYFLPIMLLTGATNVFSSQAVDSLHIKEHVLSNGLKVWLNEDHSQPKVFGAVLVKVGAKSSPNTGIPHYFEHIMFKGTENIGTLDYKEEKTWLDAIENRYDELAETTDPVQRESIQKAINELNIKAAEYVIPNEFDKLITRYGGSRLNAGTSYDYTVYFNTFSSQYMEQWAEINSERLIHPVFRLFQSELETVYEEKNMYSDAVGSQAIEKVTERYFSPHPYAYPILGSTENLKNPRLSEMRKFFESYYVASNMGLILCGDFHSEEVIPILERTFSHIRSGERPQEDPVTIPPFNGKEKIQVKVPVPLVRIMAMGFRGVPANHLDQVALNIVVGLLNNSNGTGLLDKLIVDRKVLSTMAMHESLNEAGLLGVVVVPKLLFQSHNKVESFVWEAINKVKRGAFSDEEFQSLKLEQKKEYLSALEDISSRAQMMMRVFSQDISWEEYIKSVNRIDKLTKEDIVTVANKYFGDNYLHVTKKTGKYPKEYLPKPKYAPIVSPRKEASSEYAKRLEKIPVREITPRFIDFEKDTELLPLNPLVALYITPNPVNDIFTLTLSYGVGLIEYPELNHLASYLPLLGTESDSFDVFRNKLQVLGSTLQFNVTDNDFSIRISGFDNHFKETMTLVNNFLERPKAEDKKLRQIIDEAKVMEKTFFKSSDHMATALLEKVKYGEKSRYLRKWSLSELKKKKGKDFIDLFHIVKETECTIHYVGRQSSAVVSEVVKETVPIHVVVRSSSSPFYRELIDYEEPTVFFLDMDDLSQSIVYSYIKGASISDDSLRNASKLFSSYFGGDMSSLMFQEIREFRSFAYRVNARYHLPSIKNREKPGELTTMLSTQSDKTVDAIQVLDSLLRKMPVYPERMDLLKQMVYNQVNNEFPTFRKLSEKTAFYRREGYSNDPNRLYIEDVKRMQMDDIFRFYQMNVENQPIVHIVVGSSNRIDMNKLTSLGKVIKLKKRDIYH